MKGFIVSILWSVGIFLVPYILFYGIDKCIFRLRSKRVFEEALEYGVYDGIWAFRKKFKVKKGMYDEYILTSDDGKETFVMSELHLWNCLKKKHGLSDWQIAYHDSSPAETLMW